MKRIAVFFLCAALIAASALAARLNEAEKRTLELSPAVVLITVTYGLNVNFRANNTPVAFNLSVNDTGSGFIYRPDGYIITNGHVVADANKKDAAAQEALRRSLRQEIAERVAARYHELTNQSASGNVDEIIRNLDIRANFTSGPDLTVYLANRSYYNGEIKAYSDPIGQGGKDVAIIKIDANNLPTLRLGDSSSVHVQEPMTVIGYPAAASRLSVVSSSSLFIPSVTNGHVSAIKTDFKGTPVIQSDAAITHGNSGGPAFNDAGEVIGIATFAPQENLAGFNFFVPINTALEFVNQVGVKPESGLFNRLWATALDTYAAGRCQSAKDKLQSVLNIMPNEPDALRLMQASEKCATEEGAIGRAMEGSTWLLYSAVGLVVIVVAFLLLRKKAPAPAPAVAMGGAQQLGGGHAQSAPRQELLQPSAEPSYGNIQVTAGALAGQRFKVTKAGLLIGSDASKCQICVAEDTVSREHAWIVPVDNRVVVIDRGSTNGTYINSVDSPRVSKVGLQNGDRVYLGKKGAVVLTYFSS